ncbi:MAG: hypothetical protein ACI4JY_03850 [Oscillospiraceae bacterium]
MLTDKSTNNLFKMIETDPTDFIERLDTEKLESYKSMFVGYFNELIKKQGMTLPRLVSSTTISQSYLYQIASGTRHMGRDVAIILSFVMKLDLEQTQQFLKRSNNATLYPKVRRDAIIICCKNCNMTYEETNEMLLNKGEKGLV